MDEEAKQYLSLKNMAELALSAKGIVGTMPKSMGQYFEKAKENERFVNFVAMAAGSTLNNYAKTRDEETMWKILHETAREFFLMGSWAEYGLSVFDLSHSIAAGFLLTEPAPLDGKPMNMPFPCFVVRIPDNVVPVFMGEKGFEWARILTVCRNEAVLPEEMDGLFWSARPPSGFELWRSRPWEHLEAEETPDGVTINDYNQILKEDPPVQEEDEITAKYALRVIRNLCTWLESTGGADHAKSEKGQMLSRGKKKPDPRSPNVWVVGREVKLSKEVRDSATDLVLGRSKQARAGWKVRFKSIVRGHWKMQAHGEGRELRKRLWIEPYWRGEGATFSHLYTPKEEQ